MCWSFLHLVNKAEHLHGAGDAGPGATESTGNLRRRGGENKCHRLGIATSCDRDTLHHLNNQ